MSWCGQGDEECRPPGPDHGANKPLPKETWRSRPWDFHWFFMDFSWIFHGFSWVFHGFSWIFHGCSWIFIDFS
jgi:hypothetical protein